MRVYDAGGKATGYLDKNILICRTSAKVNFWVLAVSNSAGGR